MTGKNCHTPHLVGTNGLSETSNIVAINTLSPPWAMLSRRSGSGRPDMFDQNERGGDHACKY